MYAGVPMAYPSMVPNSSWPLGRRAYISSWAPVSLIFLARPQSMSTTSPYAPIITLAGLMSR